MFNQITLEFKVKSLEEEYRSSTSTQIRHEFQYLFIFLEHLRQKCFTRTILCLYDYFCIDIAFDTNETPKNDRIYITSNTNTDWYKLQNSPTKRILIDIIKHFFMEDCLNTYIQVLCDLLKKKIAVFFQGHKIVIQTLILLPLIFIYMNPDPNTHEIIYESLISFWINRVHHFEIYVRAKQKILILRSQREQKMVRQNCLNNYIIVVSYNQSRTRLEIQKANKQVLELFGAQNDEQLRQILRNVSVKQALESSGNLNENLEDYLIKQLKDNSKKNDAQQIKVRHKPSQRKFIIKIFQNYTNGEELLVLKVVKINCFNNSRDLNVRIMNKTILIKELAYNLQASSYSLNSNIRLSKVVQTLMLVFTLCPPYMNKIIETFDISVVQFQKDLKKLFINTYRNLQLLTWDQNLVINTSQSALLFIIVSILDLFGQKEENQINFEIIVNENIDFQFQVFQISRQYYIQGQAHQLEQYVYIKVIQYSSNININLGLFPLYLLAKIICERASDRSTTISCFKIFIIIFHYRWQITCSQGQKLFDILLLYIIKKLIGGMG
ncbi:hypothetical protein pb186bvf_017295 [Paramecium bursaria]